MRKVRLHGGTHYLLTRRSPNGQVHHLDGFRRFNDAMRKWSLGSRISPICAINGSPAPQFMSREKSRVVFFGPVNPLILGNSRTSGIHFHLTLGLFNIVAVCASTEQSKAVKRIAHSENVHWEEWQLKRNTVVRTASSAPAQLLPVEPSEIVRPLPLLPPALRSAAREYAALVATAVTRSRLYRTPVADEIVEFDRLLRILLERQDLEDTVKHQFLVNANAILSRFTQQTFAGTPPINENDCHCWTHSLLGIGLASLALANIRDFAALALRRADFLARLNALRTRTAHNKHLYALDSIDPFWQRDHLAIDSGEYGQPAAESSSLLSADGQRDVPHLIAFSGRDGFRSTEISLTAPLEIIASCNTVYWTPLTLTHEISHIVITAVLSQLLPRPTQGAELDAAIAVLDLQPSSYSCLYDQVRAMLLYALTQLDSQWHRARITSEVLAEIVRGTVGEVNELLTHCFDFMYFYGSRPDVYLRMVWLSWDAIPNIVHRIPQYVLRCLCALHTSHLARLRQDGSSADALDTCIEQFVDQLNRISDEFPSSQYIPTALEYARSHRAELRANLLNRDLLVRFARHFLFSDQAAGIIQRDPLATPRSGGAYSLVVGEFSSRPVVNPLTFVERFSQDKEGDATRSSWMIAQLAFAAIR